MKDRRRSLRPQRTALLAALLTALSSAVLPGGARAEPQRLLIAPHATDDRLPEAEPPHLAAYDSADTQAPLLVWLPGTGGRPATGPRLLFEAALAQGYRLLAVSYLNSPAVSQVCTGPVLRTANDCAARMRQQRAWGEPQGRLIDDRPEDAIVPRLTRLLQHLVRTDPAGQWAQYLDGDEPRWSRVVLAGQSQGGGMAAYIAQTRRVSGVLMFSGGWDHQAGGGVAGWYGRTSVTPPAAWHGTFHVQETQAATMQQIYRRLGLPDAQIHALDLPVQGAGPHGEGIGNPGYRALWDAMLKATRPGGG